MLSWTGSSSAITEDTITLQPLAAMTWEEAHEVAGLQPPDPVLGAARVITPAIVPPPLLNLFAVVWLLLARIAFYFLVRSLGLLPTVAGAAS